MFDIGFSELLLIFVVGLVVLGPQRMPVAIRTVMKWVRTIRGLAANVQNELSQELKLQELQDSIKKAEHLNLKTLSPELAQTVEDLKQSAEKMKADLDKQAAEANQSIEEQINVVREANFEAHSAENNLAETKLNAQNNAESAVEKTQENATALQSPEPTIEDELSLDEKLASYIVQYHPAEDAPSETQTEKNV
ncbi:preprotein translocase subunit TatB [Pasteurellaceae bacterium Pebbles2]|nr:preprotein translocase subunit TatB [Pasteurellaceae bacterium Pebbles2]